MGFSIGSIFSPVTSAVSDLTGGLSDKLLGDVSGEEQQAAQAAENLASREFIQQQAEQARGDVLNLFPAAEQARQQGTQAALDIFGQTIPQQLGVFQQGNVGAQQALTQGLPQILAALRGTPVDISQIQPQALAFDPSFAQQQLPQFQSTSELFSSKASNPILRDSAAGRGGEFAGTIKSILDLIKNTKSTDNVAELSVSPFSQIQRAGGTSAFDRAQLGQETTGQAFSGLRR